MAEAAASRTSTCSSPRSGVSRANAGWAAFPNLPRVVAAIVRIFGVGSFSRRAERRDGLGRGRAVALDASGRPRIARPGPRCSSRPIDDGQGLAARRAQGADGVDRLPLDPRVGVVEQGHEVVEQAFVARGGLEEDLDRPAPESPATRRCSTARTAGTDSAARGPRSPRATRNAVLTSGSGSARPAVSFCAVPGASGRICPRARAAPRRTRGSGASTARMSRLDGRPADLGQRLGDRVDPAPLAAEGVEQPGGRVRARLAEQERGVACDPVARPRTAATRAPAPSAGSKVRPSTSRLTTARRTRSSSCRRFSRTIGSRTSSGSPSLASDLMAAARTSGAASSRRPQEGPARPGRPARTAARGPRPPARGRRRPGPPRRRSGARPRAGRSGRAPGRPRDGRGRSRRRAGGSGRGRRPPRRARSAPGPSTTSARTLSFRSFSRPRRPSTAGLPMAARARADR